MSSYAYADLALSIYIQFKKENKTVRDQQYSQNGQVQEQQTLFHQSTNTKRSIYVY
ncbi:hypothetical protein pb186bvf_005015 [Paramecium bursaria]